MPGKAFAWPFQVFFLQTIKSIQHCMGIECYKILRFPKTEMWKKKHMFFFKMWFTNACPPHVLVYFIPYHIQLTKSSLPGVVWPWSLVCHCGWVWFYMKAQLSWWPGSLAFRWWFRADFLECSPRKLGKILEFSPRKLGKIPILTKKLCEWVEITN